MKNPSIDMETLQAITAMVRPAPVAPIAPVAPVAPLDRDSFASFTGGLRQNWVILMALLSVGFWMVTNIMQINNTNQIQTDNIDKVTKTVDSLSVVVSAKQISDVSTVNDIVRRLDLLQNDINILKTK